MEIIKYNGEFHLIDKNENIGSCFIQEETTTKSSLWEFIINEKFRGKGYSKIFLKLLVNDLKKKEVKVLELGVMKENIIAQNLYKSFGFTKQKDCGLYYRMILKIK